MEELARTLREEETVNYVQDSSVSPTAPPPPDIVTDLSSGQSDPDTSQLVGRISAYLTQHSTERVLYLISDSSGQILLMQRRLFIYFFKFVISFLFRLETTTPTL